VKRSFFPLLRNRILLIVLLASAFTGFEAKATHMAGSEIEYECLGPRRWKVRLTVYRYCDPGAADFCFSFSCPQTMTATPSPTIAAAGLNPNGCTANPSSVPFTVQLVKVEDVNKLVVARCGQQSKNNCSNLGQVTPGPYRPSVERYIFEGELNLNLASLNTSNTCPYWDIGWAYCCRNVTENVQGQPGNYCQATINIFDQTGTPCRNSSPVFKNQAVQILYPQQETIFNLGATDPDGDSLSYKIVKALQAANTPVNYNSPYNERYIFPLNENLPPHNTQPPTSPFVVIDSVNGDISLNAKNTSTQPIGGNLCVQVTQWRYKEQPAGSGIKVPYITGITMRDLQTYSVPAPANKPPRFATNPALPNGQPKYDWTVCAGEQVCFTITATDSIATDSTWISWNQVINRPANKLTFVPDYDTAAVPSQRPREDRWKFCWQTEATDTNSYPYYFSVRGDDNRCPSIGTIMKSFSVKVLSRAEADLVKTSPGCSKWHLQMRKINGLQSFFAARMEIAKAPFDYTFANGKITINAANPNPTGTGSAPRVIIQDSVQFTQPGKYLVRYFATASASGCESTYTDTIVVSDNPLNVNVQDTVKCRFTDVVLVAHASAGVPPYQYRWYGGSLTSPVINDSLVAQNGSAAVYQLEVKDSTGCSLVKPVTVNVKALPQDAIVVNESQQCVDGNNFKFSHLPVTTLQNYTRTWLYENQTTTDSSFTISYTTAGVKTVKLVIVEANGCIDTAVKTVMVAAAPAVNNVIQVNDSIQCVTGNVFSYSRTALPGHTYKWLLANGGTSVNVAWGEVYTTAGTKTMRLEIRNQQGCIDTAERSVLVTSKPSAGTFSINDTLQCITGNSFTFNHSPATGLTYKWLYDNKNSTDSSVSYSYSTSGTKTIRLTATEIGGCKDTVTKAVIVTANPIVTDLIYVKDSIQCITNNQFEISYLLRNNRNIFKHTWLIDGIESDSAIINYTYSSPGTKQLKLVVKQEGGCADTAIRSVMVGTTPVMGNIIQVNDSIQCINNNSFQFSYNSANNPQVFKHTWLKDGVSFANPVLTATYQTAGFKEVKLIVSQDKACSDTAVRQIEIAPRPVVQNVIEVNDSVQCLMDNQFILEYKRPAGATDYFTWRINGTSFFTSPLVQQFQSDGIRQVRLVVINKAGCSDSATMSLTVKASPSAATLQGPVSSLLAQSEYDYNIGSQQAGHTYKWYVNNGSFVGANDSAAVRVKWLAGTASLKVEQTLDGCTDVDSINVAVGSVGIRNITSLQHVFVKPNPNKGVFTIGLESVRAQQVQATLHNVLGELVWSDEKNIGSGLSEVEVDVNVPDGIYLLTVYDHELKTVKRVMINR
jgi:PKD repeat protein